MESVTRSTQDLHPEGRSGFDFVDAKTVLTCGKDGIVRLVSLSPLEDSGVACHDDADRQLVRLVCNPSNRSVFALAKEEDGFNSFVQLFELQRNAEETTKVEPLARLTQTNLGICDLSWSSSGVWMAVATDSDGIKVMKVADPVKSIVLLKDHQGAVKGVEFDPSGTFLASVGADGSLRVFESSGEDDASKQQWTCVKHKQKFCDRDSSVSSSELSDCKPSWSADGSLLAVPGARTVRVLKRGDWDEELSSMEQALFPSAVTLTCFSPTRLAACSGASNDVANNKLVIWNLKTRKIEYSFERFDEPFFRSLKFFAAAEGEDGERLVAIDAHGQMVQYQLPSLGSSPSSSSSVSLATAAKEEEEDLAPTLKLSQQFASQMDDEEDKQDSAGRGDSLLKIKESMGFNEDLVATKTTTTTASSKVLDQLASQDDAELFAAEDDDDGDDDGDRRGERDDLLVDKSAVEDLQQQIAIVRHSIRPLLPSTSLDAFQPGSTEFPVRKSEDDVPLDEDPDRRFLAWNNVGTIVCRRDKEHQSIEIDFADSSLHRPIRFTDYKGLSKASLSEVGAFFASSSSSSSSKKKRNTDLLDNDDDNDGEMDDDVDNDNRREAVLQYRAFTSPWSSTANWSFTLPNKKEDVVAVAAGNDFCVAATTAGFLRVFRPSGLQEPILLSPGPVLSMAAAGSLLLVLYHTTQRRNDMETGYQLLDLGKEGGSETLRVLASGTLPCVRPIVWCGFADESLGFMPLVYRRDGVLLGLACAMSWSWIVLSNGTGLEKGTKLWPISASRQGGLLAVALRNKRKQPSVVPRSVPALFAIHIPLLRDNYKQKSLKYDHEETQMQDVLALEQRRWAGVEDEIVRAEAKLDVATLKAFVVAVKMKEFSRALGLASKLRMSKSLEVALEKATEADANSDFLEKLTQLVDERNQPNDDDGDAEDGEQEEEEEDQRPPTKRARRSAAGEEEEEDRRSMSQRTTSSSVRVGFNRNPAVTSASEDEDDRPSTNVMASPVMDKKRSVLPPNPFLKSASPATRDKRPQQRTSPIRLPELSRQASFTVEAREQYKRRL